MRGYPVNLDLTVAQAAYFAGIMDADGCLGIYPQSSSKGYSKLIQVTNRRMELINWLKENIGGRASTGHVTYRGEKREYYIWATGGTVQITGLLKIILPYLTIKKVRAELMLEVLEKTIPPDVGYRRMKVLNNYMERDSLYQCDSIQD